jgi:CRISPR-associated protein Cas5t
MRVLKIELEGTTTSFRYPHFMVGRQPSYALPPPATIYGHISSALGDWPDRNSFRFGYSFRYAGKGDDLESIHVAEIKPGWIDKKAGISRNLEATVNPVPREVMLWPCLSLYIDTPDLEEWYARFRTPRYPVLLGRSQDLASYRSVEIVDLIEGEVAYYEGTLLTTDYRQRTTAGVMTNMPLYINPENRRQVDWNMYLLLENKIRLIREGAGGPNVVYCPPEIGPLWIDPGSPKWSDLQRAVAWHSFTKE